MLSIFSCACWPSICLLWRNVYLGLLLIFLLHFFFNIELHCIFWRLILCQLLCLQVFSILSVFFSSCLWFFCLEKGFKLNQVPLVYFCFHFHYSRRWVKNTQLLFMMNSILLIFSSKTFIVSAVTFRSLIHFEFIFVYGIGSVLVSFFHMQLSSFPSTTY